MADERLRRAATAILAGMVCAVLGMTALAQASLAASDAEDTESADPTELRIPHLGELNLSVNAAWTLPECPELAADPWVELECTPEGEAVLRALDYDPGAGPWTLRVAVIDSLGLPREITYSVVLDDPEPPVLVSGSLPLVGVAGGRTLIPISALVTECIQCTKGITIIAAVVVDPNVAPPKNPARVWIAQDHLVVDAPADATEVTIGLLVADDTGIWGAPSEFTLPVRNLAEVGAVGLHRDAVVAAQAALEVTLEDLVITDTPESWVIERCGTPTTGTARCDATSLHYTAGEASDLADQVWVLLRSEAGDVVVASVTITAQNESPAGTLTLGWAPAGVGSATAAIAIPSPELGADGAGASNPGALAALWRVLPRLTPEPSPDEELTP